LQLAAAVPEESSEADAEADDEAGDLDARGGHCRPLGWTGKADEVLWLV